MMLIVFKNTLIIVAIFILFNNCSAQHTYYVSSNGNDRNSGLSSTSPLRTISNFTPGNTYLLKAGDTLYFNIKINNLTTGKPIVIGRYGNGAKPVVSLYRTVKFKSWRRVAQNIFRINLKNSDNFNGYDDSSTNIGFFKIGDKIYGSKKRSFNELAKIGDFYTDDTNMYVYGIDSLISPNIPLMFPSNKTILGLSNNLTVRDIKLLGSSGHGINGVNCKNVKIINVDVSDIGGAYLFGYKNGKTRFGNGIQFWKGAENCLVEGCSVNNVYDAAYTMQGDGDSDFKDVVFRKNRCNNNEQSFEFWIKGGKSGFVNCEFSNNVCLNAGFGWAHEVRPDKAVGVHILNYVWESRSTGLIIKDNIFENARSGLIYYNEENIKSQMFKVASNKVFLDQNTPFRSIKLIPKALTNKTNSSKITSNSVLNIQNGFIIERRKIFK